MFDNLSDRLEGIFDKLKRKGALKDEDVGAALREVRVALLEADVALPVVKDFIDAVRERAVGQEVMRGINPGQQVVKVVHDHLVETLGAETTDLNLVGNPPIAVMMVGLQGSGKTTSTAKIARWIQAQGGGKKVLMASLDVRRPAAQQQLAVLGEQAHVETLDIVMGELPVQIARRAMDRGRKNGFDVVMLDTAGRLHLDDELMEEAAAVRAATNPQEVLLVADAMTGQDAVNVASAFKEKVGVTGIMLTRVDGDARGGAALSMRAVAGCPIKLMGVGEKLEEIEAFHPDRIAGRILGMGDVVSLVEKAAATIEEEDAERFRKKFEKGQKFDLDDMWVQLKQLRKMGGMDGLMGLLPGVGKAKKQMAAAKMDDSTLKRQEAILSSMTPKERNDPRVIHASRKRRIAAGSGVQVQDINRLLKQYQEMNGMMKKVRKMGKKGQLPPGMEMPGMPGGSGAGGGTPSQAELEQMAQGLKLPPGFKF
ncbi:MAG: signal recognition particle protein [Alphaproteobacteria bacterium]|nr:signal recognition particle protein [Alphaproteobacteria bacterium]